uniref:hypothetical protein n=1 Tax=Sahlingia subintegra TaxID=468936 RepID=UPI001FCE1B6A|nr:hypothetical protein MW427_pgp114 [Sahlingia subintegra]UNJ17312.1 hypothetical protein [Sahlingia subintegra]
MEILDPDFIDDFFQSLYFTSKDLLERTNILSLFVTIRFSNVMRFSYKSHVLTIPDLFIVAYAIFELFSSKHWIILLKNLFDSRRHFTEENSLLSSFFRKYRFYYKKKMHKYRVGKVDFENDNHLNAIAISYAYLLYLIVKQKDFYFFLDCLYNFSYSTD